MLEGKVISGRKTAGKGESAILLVSDHSRVTFINFCLSKII